MASYSGFPRSISCQVTLFSQSWYGVEEYKKAMYSIFIASIGIYGWLGMISSSMIESVGVRVVDEIKYKSFA